MRIFKAGKRIRKIAAAGVTACLFACTLFSAAAFALEPWPSECYVLSEGACLMDADSGVILVDKNADSQYYPASITKVLTALLTIENCENLSEIVTFSFDAVHLLEANSTIIGASEGDRLSVLDCLYCLLFQSANEVANALGEHVGAKHPELKEKGQTDLDVFVKMMNEKAVSLGCTGSHFNNPSGLTDSNHYTTPHDMCLIMKACIENPTFLDIESHSYWKHAPIRRYPDAEDPCNTVYMKHLMLRKNSAQYYRGCIAGKTGYTTTAGNTLVTACRKDGMTLVACVMNAHANHYTDTESLFDFGFANFRSVSVNDYDTTNAKVQQDFRIEGVPVMDSHTVGLREESRITIPKGGDYTEVSREFVTTDLSVKDALAELRYYYGEHLAGTTALALLPLGGMNEVKAAREDRMFYQVSGLPMPEPETEAMTGEGGGTEEASSQESSGGETSAGENTADARDTQAAEETTEETEEETTAGPAEKAEKKGPPVWAWIVGGIVLFLFAGTVILWFVAKKKEARRRKNRRRRQMQQRSGLSGPQSAGTARNSNRRIRKNESEKY